MLTVEDCSFSEAWSCEQMHAYGNGNGNGNGGCGLCSSCIHVLQVLQTSTQRPWCPTTYSKHVHYELSLHGVFYVDGLIVMRPFTIREDRSKSRVSEEKRWEEDNMCLRGKEGREEGERERMHLSISPALGSVVCQSASFCVCVCGHVGVGITNGNSATYCTYFIWRFNFSEIWVHCVRRGRWITDKYPELNSNPGPQEQTASAWFLLVLLTTKEKELYADEYADVLYFCCPGTLLLHSTATLSIHCWLDAAEAGLLHYTHYGCFKSPEIYDSKW